MVAVVEVDGDHTGTADTPNASPFHNVANFRFQNEDTNDQDTAAPITIPSAGTVFAFWRHIFLHCTTAPDTQIDNVRIHTDDVTPPFTGVNFFVGNGTQTKNSGSSAGYDPGQALVLTTHDTITAQTDFFTFGSGDPRSVTISEAGSVINAIGELTDYVVLQCEVGTTAVQGVQAPAETITWLYDEI